MNEEQFEHALEQVIQELKETLLKKRKEYAPNYNKFQNFVDGARISGQPMEIVLDGYLLKHYVSYRDMLKQIENGNQPEPDLVNEKLGDIVTYFILQKILMLYYHQ